MHCLYQNPGNISSSYHHYELEMKAKISSYAAEKSNKAAITNFSADLTNWMIKSHFEMEEKHNNIRFWE